MASCSLDIRLTVSLALHTLAASVILVHNHPSGDLQPSNADTALTKRTREALRLVDLKLLDHIIISEKAGLSMFEKGLI